MVSKHLWKETSLIFQSSKVPKKSNLYLMRSCSNFFEDWHLDACKCLWQLTWDLLFFSLVSSIRVTHLACVLIGSLAKLWFSFCMQSLLMPWRWLMLSLARWSNQWLLSWLLKSDAIPNSFMDYYQEWGHVAAYYSSHTQPYQVLNRTFCNWSLFVLNHIRFWKEPFAIRVVKEVQLPLGLGFWAIPFEVFHDCGTSLFE